MIQNFKTSINNGFHSISVNKIGEIGLEKLFGKMVSRNNPYFEKSVFRKIRLSTNQLMHSDYDHGICFRMSVSVFIYGGAGLIIRISSLFR